MTNIEISTALTTFGAPAIAYIAGLFTEPAKKWLSNRLERNRLQNALYSELAVNVNHLLPYVSNLQLPANYPLPAESLFRYDVYQDAITKQPVLYHEIREANTLSELYLFLRDTKEGTTEQRIAKCTHFQEWVTRLVNKGSLSRRRLHYYERAIGEGTLLNFEHPFRKRLKKLYWRLLLRNVPRNPPVMPFFEPSDTIFKKLLALYRGVPGRIQKNAERDQAAQRKMD